MYAIQINGFTSQEEARLFVEWYRNYGEENALNNYGIGPTGEKLTGNRFPQLCEPALDSKRVPEDTEIIFIEMKSFNQGK